MEMSEIHFNEAEDLRITRVEQFVPGKRYLLVHNRKNDESNSAPSDCSEVWAIGTEFTSFHELRVREGRSWHLSEHSLANRWFLFYVAAKSGRASYSAASDHGFTDSIDIAHKSNYVLDLEDLEAQGITLLRAVSPGTDMSYDREDMSNEDWRDFDSVFP